MERVRRWKQLHIDARAKRHADDSAIEAAIQQVSEAYAPERPMTLQQANALNTITFDAVADITSTNINCTETGNRHANTTTSNNNFQDDGDVYEYE